jgi:fatty acid desaturase
MASRLPAAVQPFITWLTARPAPGEAERSRPAWSYVSEALLWIVVGTALGALALQAGPPLATALLPPALVATTSGLGLFQVVVFHHCSHGTVFARPEHNRNVGRLISALLLFKHFDAYRREHMLHHNARKLLTEEDEFADFVLEMCRLEPGLPKRELWRRVLVNVVLSPAFHLRFLRRRVRASLRSPDTLHNAIGSAVWLGALAAAAITGHLTAFLVLWVLPVTLLLQIATVGRILCEHRFPEPALIAARGREFVCRATSGVFPGAMPPAAPATSLAGLAAWTAWWADMLTVQLLVRVFVLVGDAPCHDFHHRRPATRDWTSYIHARQRDVDAGCPGYPLNYGESWGLFRAIDENLATLARTPREVIRPAAR